MVHVALIHSPLVGPFTWLPVTAELQQRGNAVIVPNLHNKLVVAKQPYHQQHAQNAANALRNIPKDEPIVLVAHSGAGPLLPAIRQLLPNQPAAYIFVDAGIAYDGQSRLDMLAEELPDAAPQLNELLDSGQRWPQWTDADLADLVPDAERLQRLLAELTPQPLAFFAEPIPVFSGWPDAPCAYLQLSAGYAYSAAQAGRRGWPIVRLDAGHFHMLVDETAVTNHILQLLTQLAAF